MQIGKEFGLEGEKLLEFVREQLKLEEEKEEKRRQLEEEKEEKRRLLEEQKEEKRRMLEEDRRKEDEEREARRQERELRKLELEAELLKQKEAIEVAKREHELELARLAQGRNVVERAELREDRAKANQGPHLSIARTTWMLTYNDLRDSQLQLNGRRQDGLRNVVLFCLDVP